MCILPNYHHQILHSLLYFNFCIHIQAYSFFLPVPFQTKLVSFLSTWCLSHSSARSFRSWLCSVLPFLGRWSRDGRVKMSIFSALGLLLFILICIQKATTSFDIVAYKRISEFSAKVGLFGFLFHFFRIVERQFLRLISEVQRTFVRDNRITQLLF